MKEQEQGQEQEVAMSGAEMEAAAVVAGGVSTSHCHYYCLL